MGEMRTWSFSASEATTDDLPWFTAPTTAKVGVSVVSG